MTSYFVGISTREDDIIFGEAESWRGNVTRFGRRQDLMIVSYVGVNHYASL